jgi:PIN domain
VVVLEDYKDITLEEVVRRGVHRIRPASDNGEELRDVVIWLVVLEHAKAKNSEVAFITDDGHFKGPDENFHLATHKVELKYYDSIPKFVRVNALELSIVAADEIAPIVKEGVIADLVTDLFKRDKLEDVIVSDIQFQGAQKYKVADDSFYVEATYITVVRYSVITAPLSRFSLSATSSVQGGPFRGIGRRVPPPSILPIKVRRNYEAVVNLVLSFRTVADTTQSVEILDIEIIKHTQLAEVPVVASEDPFVP